VLLAASLIDYLRTHDLGAVLDFLGQHDEAIEVLRELRRGGRR